LPAKAGARNVRLNFCDGQGAKLIAIGGSIQMVNSIPIEIVLPLSWRDPDLHRSPGHHFDGGSLAEIFVARSATRWLRLNG
jgi:hypothetical protein